MVRFNHSELFVARTLSIKYLQIQRLLMINVCILIDTRMGGFCSWIQSPKERNTWSLKLPRMLWVEILFQVQFPSIPSTLMQRQSCFNIILLFSFFNVEKITLVYMYAFEFVVSNSCKNICIYQYVNCEGIFCSRWIPEIRI